jgi:hemolysin III
VTKAIDGDEVVTTGCEEMTRLEHSPMHAAAMSARVATASRYSVPEEIVHSVTHGIGAVLAVAALVTLVLGAVLHGGVVTIVATTTSIYGSTLVLLYVSSTIYHSLPYTLPRAKDVFQIFDHAAIHLLIAGTYTPLALCAIGGALGSALLAGVWSLAAVGVVVETTPLRRFKRVSIGLYLAMGWLCAPTLPALWHVLPASTLGLLALGGLMYTSGVLFYLGKRRWMHAWWHGFVLAASALHVAAVALIVLP